MPVPPILLTELQEQALERVARLTVRFGDSGCITWRIPPWEGTFDYDRAADTLVDHEGITWHRGQ